MSIDNRNVPAVTIERWFMDADGVVRYFAATFHGDGPAASRADFYLDGAPAKLVAD